MSANPPDATYTPLAWLRADDLAQGTNYTSDGDNITGNWTNRGSGDDFAAVGGQLTPAINLAAKNGYKSVVKDEANGTRQVYAGSGSQLSLAGVFTIAIVHKSGTDGVWPFLVGGDGASDSNGVSVSRNNASTSCAVWDTDIPGEVALASTILDGTAQRWHIEIVRRGPDNALYAYSDGLHVNGGNSTDEEITLNSLFQLKNATALSDQGTELTEIIIYNKFLSNPDVVELYDYLNALYEVTVPEAVVPMYTLRSNSVLTGTGADAQFSSSAKVYATSVGAVASAPSNGSTISVYAGHSFVAGDKALINPGTTGGDTFTAAIDSVTATSIVFDPETYAISIGDVLVNLGPDTGTDSPNYDACKVQIYSRPGSDAVISNSTVTADSQGNYEYYHRGYGLFWELILDSTGSPSTVIQGHGGGAWCFNVHDFGAAGDGTTDDGPAIEAAAAAAGSIGGNSLKFLSLSYLVSTQIDNPVGVDWYGTHSPSNLPSVASSLGTKLLRGADVVMVNMVADARTDADRIGNLSFNGIQFSDGSDIGSSSMIYAKWCDRVVFNDCTMYGPSGNTINGHMVEVEECLDWHHNGCVFKNYGDSSAGKFAFNIYNGATAKSSGFHWTRCQFIEGLDNAIVSNASGAGSTFNDKFYLAECKFTTSSNAGGLYVTGPINHIYISECEFDDGDAQHIALDSTCVNGVIYKNHFHDLNDNGNEYIYIDGSQNVIIEANRFDGIGSGTNNFVYLDGTSAGNELRGCKVINNSFTESVEGTTPMVGFTGTVHVTVEIRGNGVYQDETATTTASTKRWPGNCDVDTSGGAFTLTVSDGIKVGDVKTIRMTADSGDCTVSVTNHETDAPELFTLDDVDDFLSLMWQGTHWVTQVNSGALTP